MSRAWTPQDLAAFDVAINEAWKKHRANHDKMYRRRYQLPEEINTAETLVPTKEFVAGFLAGVVWGAGK